MAVWMSAASESFPGLFRPLEVSSESPSDFPESLAASPSACRARRACSPSAARNSNCLRSRWNRGRLNRPPKSLASRRTSSHPAENETPQRTIATGFFNSVTSQDITESTRSLRISPTDIRKFHFTHPLNSCQKKCLILLQRTDQKQNAQRQFSFLPNCTNFRREIRALLRAMRVQPPGVQKRHWGG